MADSITKEVGHAVAEAIDSLLLVEESGQPAQVKERDKPVFLPRVDDVPIILVTPTSLDQQLRYQSAHRATRLFPNQITIVGASNASTVSGRGLVQEWKEAIWTAFLKQQPRILQDAFDNLFTQTVTEGQTLIPEAWKGQYDVLVLFIMVELELNLD